MYPSQQKDVNQITLFALAGNASDKRWLLTGKRAMQTISRTLEDGAIDAKNETIFYGGFQKLSYFLVHAKRYQRLAGCCSHIYVFGVPDVEPPPIPGITYVPLDPEAPLAHEWFLIYNSPNFFSALLANDVSGFNLPEDERQFEGIWTFDARIVELAERGLTAALERTRGLTLVRRPLYQPLSRTAADNERQLERERQANRYVLLELDQRNKQMNKANIELSALQDENVRLQNLLRSHVTNETWLTAQAAAGANKTTLEPRLREATVLFTDIVEFTAFSQILPPTEVVELLNGYFDLLSAVVYNYDGDIDKYIGDSMMVVFDDPQHALQAAEAMLAANIAFNRSQQQRGLPLLQTRIGVDCGTVLLGNVGSQNRTDRTHIGDAVNIASRLQELAQPNSVLVSETVWQAAKQPPNYQQRPDVQVRGRRRTLNAYQYIYNGEDGQPDGRASQIEHTALDYYETSQR